MKKAVAWSTLLVSVFASLSAKELVSMRADADNPRELGQVAWLRDYDQAISVSRETGKPVFLLFQEIPGCATCVEFGDAPLSHPLIVEAIETHFVPLAIHNNKPGQDAEILSKFNEPAWNFPVARFIDADGTDIIARADRIWDTHGIAKRMIDALDAAGRNVPKFLQLIEAESNESALQPATFAMACYWEGEAQLGALEGVIRTKAGWMNGHETVDLLFDPELIDYETLLSAAQSRHCASVVYPRNPMQLTVARRLAETPVRLSDTESRTARTGDQKYYLQFSTLRHVPLTPAQATKVNAALRLKTDPLVWLSLSQRELAGTIELGLQARPDALAVLAAPETLVQWADYRRAILSRLSVED